MRFSKPKLRKNLSVKNNDLFNAHFLKNVSENLVLELRDF
ncbi:MAG: hypothetical protein ACI9XO_000580 [Paraglaciecola sp.]|jgi:hypothetical protein